MKKLLSAIAVASALLATSAMADGHGMLKSRWGADDQAGASNWMNSKQAMKAIRLMKTGTVVSLGREYTAEMPLFGTRAFAVRGTSGLAGGPVGANKVVWMDDYVATEIGQVGTQFDGLSHIGIGTDAGPVFYNNIPGNEVFGANGVNKLGMEHVKPFFTRGILLDITAVKGGPMDAGDEITLADVKAALRKQGIDEPGDGDVVLFYTGWTRYWITDNAKYNAGCPGIGMEVGKWLVSKNISVVGSDTWPVEVVPNPDSSQAFPVHQELITRNGIFIHENVNTKVLADAGVYEFAYIFSPVRIKGGTGSPGAPLAVY